MPRVTKSMRFTISVDGGVVRCDPDPPEYELEPRMYEIFPVCLDEESAELWELGSLHFEDNPLEMFSTYRINEREIEVHDDNQRDPEDGDHYRTKFGVSVVRIGNPKDMLYLDPVIIND